MLLALIGLLTLVAAAIHGAAGAAASGTYWAIVTPIALVYLIWRAERRDGSRRAALVVAGLAALTFGAGTAFGSITAADTALGFGVVALGGITRTPLLAAAGAAIAATALTLEAADGAGAWTAFSTGAWLLASGSFLVTRPSGNGAPR